MQWLTPTNGLSHNCATVLATIAVDTKGAPIPGPKMIEKRQLKANFHLVARDIGALAKNLKLDWLNSCEARIQPIKFQIFSAHTARATRLR